MDAPLFELIIRAITVLVAFFAFYTTFELWRAQKHEINPVRHLTLFMVLVLFALLVDRIYVLWVGLQHDSTGDWGLLIEPYVRSIGASLLGLILLGAGLLSTFFLRNKGTRA